MDPNPRIEGESVSALPRGVVHDGGERKAVLPAGTNRSDERSKAGPSGHRHHCGEYERTQTGSLVLRLHFGGQGRERGRDPGILDGSETQRVDPAGEVLESAVPTERNGSGPSNHIARPPVDKQCLKVGEPGNEISEIAGRLRSMQIVFGPQGIEQPSDPDALGEIRSLLRRDNLEPGWCALGCFHGVMLADRGLA